MISVIIPVFNGERFIAKTIDSILSNTYQDFEVIIIDDGSTDNTRSICDSYVEKDSRITVYTQNNRGVSAARNKGLEIAKGDYICFIDADDSIDKYYLDKLNQFISYHQLDWVECGIKYVEDNKEIVTQLYYPDNRIYTNRNITKQIRDHVFSTEYGDISLITSSVCAGIYRASAIQTLKFEEDLSYGEDLFFNYQLMHRIDGYGYFAEPLYYYVTENSKSNKKKESLMESIIAFLLRIEIERKEYCEEVSTEELRHVFLKFLSILTYSIFPSSTHEERVQDYKRLDTYLHMPIIMNLLQNITPSIFKSFIYRILVTLFKSKRYGILYLLWLLRRGFNNA